MPPARHPSLTGCRIAVVAHSAVCAVETSIVQRLSELVDACEVEGDKVDRGAALPADARSTNRVYVWLLRAVMAPSVTDREFEIQSASASRLDDDDDSYPAQVTRALTQTYRDWFYAAEERLRMQRSWAEFFESYDALLRPATSTTAWAHNTTENDDRVIHLDGARIGYYDQLFWAGLTGVVYLPSTVIPMGCDPSGLPMGVQDRRRLSGGPHGLVGGASDRKPDRRFCRTTGFRLENLRRKC